MNARIRHPIRLKLGHVHVERAVEAQRRRQRADHLRHQPVQVHVRRALDVERAAADVVDGLVVQHHRHVGVLEQRVRGQHRVVRLHHRRADLRRRVHGEAELALLAVAELALLATLFFSDNGVVMLF